MAVKVTVTDCCWLSPVNVKDGTLTVTSAAAADAELPAGQMAAPWAFPRSQRAPVHP